MLNTVVTALSAIVIGIVSWGSKMQSDVNVNETKIVDLKELISSKLDDIDKRLGRIERALNGRLHGDSRYDHR